MSTKKSLIFTRNRIIVLFCLLFFLIYFIGSFHNIPFWSHTDEVRAITTSIKIGADPNPHFFDWGTFYFYTTFPAYGVMYVVGDYQSINHFIATYTYHPQNFIVLGRMLSVLFATLALAFIFKLSSDIIKDEYLWMIPGLLLGSNSVFVKYASLALPEALMILLGVAGIYLVVKNHWVEGAAVLGLATATKYNAALFVIFCAGWVAYRNNWLRSVKFVATSIVSFFIVTPFAILDYKVFVSDILIILNNRQWFDRHWLPLIVLFVFILIMFISLLKRCKKSLSLNIIISIFCILTFTGLFFVVGLAKTSPDVLMAFWIEQNVPDGSTIYVEEWGPPLTNTRENLINKTYLSESRDAESFNRFRQALQEWPPNVVTYDLRQVWKERIQTGEAHAGGPACYTPIISDADYIIIDSWTEEQNTCLEQKEFYKAVREMSLVKSISDGELTVEAYSTR